MLDFESQEDNKLSTEGLTPEDARENRALECAILSKAPEISTVRQYKDIFVFTAPFMSRLKTGCAREQPKLF